MDLRVVLAGLVVGTLVGMTGMGGGALMAPILIFLFGMRPVAAVGTDLAYSAITKAFGAWQHHRQGTVDYRLVTYLALGSVPASLGGVGLMSVLQRYYDLNVDDFVLRLLGLCLMIVAIIISARALLQRERAVNTGYSLTRGRKALTIGWGAVVGFLVGLTSVGSGSLLVPFLALVFPLSASMVVGTDIFHAVILVSVAGVAHLLLGGIACSNCCWLLFSSSVARK